MIKDPTAASPLLRDPTLLQHVTTWAAMLCGTVVATAAIGAIAVINYRYYGDVEPLQRHCQRLERQLAEKDQLIATLAASRPVAQETAQDR
jgi:hypothetical protein